MVTASGEKLQLGLQRLAFRKLRYKSSAGEDPMPIGPTSSTPQQNKSLYPDVSNARHISRRRKATQPASNWERGYLRHGRLGVLRSLLARVILAAGNAIILAYLTSRPEVSYTQWYI